MSNPATPPAGDCFEAGAPLMPVADAREAILAGLPGIVDTETIRLSEALGRVLANDVVAEFDVPPHTNSAMDGYAVAAADLPAAGSENFRVIGVSRAGHGFAGRIGHLEAVDITTGAPMPEGADTVVIQENVTRTGDNVTIGPGNAGGQNVRAAGEDIRAGATVLPAGRRLGPAAWGVVASLGIGRLPVRRRLRVAIMSTGDELRDAGEPRDSHCIYDSNRYLLRGMLARIGAEVTDLGIVEDDPGAIRAALIRAADEADIVITSAGVSTGEADFVSELLRSEGRLTVWRIAIRPGRPFAQARYRGAEVFALPGNPVAVVVTYTQFVEPALRKLSGETELDPVPVFHVECGSRLRKKPGRTELYRGMLEPGPDGRLVVRSTGRQGSGLLTSVAQANCFVLLPDESDTVEPGTLVAVQPFSGLL